LQECDLFVYFSNADNLPNILVEAQSCGVPVLAWNVGGVSETFAPGKSGFLVEKNKEKAISELIRVIEARDILPIFSRQARANATKYFSYERVVKLYEEVYDYISSLK